MYTNVVYHYGTLAGHFTNFSLRGRTDTGDDDDSDSDSGRSVAGVAWWQGQTHSKDVISERFPLPIHIWICKLIYKWIVEQLSRF